MFSIGWPEFTIILIVGLMVIGPRDLPKALHQVGKWVGAARRMSRDFQRHVDDMVRDSELQDLRDGVNTLRKTTNVRSAIENTIDPDKSLRKAVGGRFDVTGDGDKKAAGTKAGNGDALAVEDKGAEATANGAVREPRPDPGAEEVAAAPAAQKPATAKKPAAPKKSAAKSTKPKAAAKGGDAKAASTRSGTSRSGSGKTTGRAGSAKSTSRKPASAKSSGGKSGSTATKSRSTGSRAKKPEPAPADAPGSES